MAKHRQQSKRHYPRTARLNELIRQILADALERLDDDRLELVTVTGVACEADLQRAEVFFDNLRGAEGDAEVQQALAELRPKLQSAIARQTTFKRTPELFFTPDPAVRAAARVDELLRGIGTDDPKSGLLGQQIAYYRARAGEYEEWWHTLGPQREPTWWDEVAAAEAELAQAEPTGDVLELAAGTGVWTRILARTAASITAVDASIETLDRNLESLPEGSCPVEFVEADLFNWEPDRRYDLVFFSFWLSHVPPERVEQFFELVERCLAPGGRFFCLDNLASDWVSEDLGEQVDETVTLRRLKDGREFHIVKVFPQPDELRERLTALGWDVATGTTGRCFVWARGRRHPQDD